MRWWVFARVIEPTLRTDRLELWHLSIADMQEIMDNPDSRAVWTNKPFQNSFNVFVGDTGPLRWRLPQAKKDPSTNKWFVRLIIEKTSNNVIGSVSFHEPPNAEGVLEVGLAIVPAKQRNGYATEALIAMWTWATEHDEVKTLRYCVGVDNQPSQALIASLGFSRVGQQIDDIDGPEDIFEMSAAEFRRLLVAT